ncbi:MAG TPA: AraC family transcriptional regulator [Ramlibacter sp.]
MSHAPERMVFSSTRIAVGEWRCDRTHPLFADSGPIQRHMVAFPRTSVKIRHEGGDGFIADAGVATIYNQGQRYTREVVHPLGDHCDFWAVDRETAADIASSIDTRVGRDDDKPLRHARAPVDASLYLRQRAVLLGLRRGEIDALAAEEAVIAVVHDAVAAAARAAGADRARSRAPSPGLVEAATRELAASWHERLTLDVLSARLGTSPFHLCHAFRAATGHTLHRQLTLLRLRAALEAVAERGEDLTHIALEHGFSSHSHFTSAFRREWGVTPSAWRARLHGTRT